MTAPSYAKPTKGAPDQAVAYLFGLPVNVVTLTAIIPDGPTTTATFRKTADDRMKIIKWITERQAERQNIYFQDCSVVTINKRPVKADVALIHCAHADLDVKGELSPEAHATALRAILAALEGYKLPPTDVICTGNGIQAFWYIAEPLAASPENIEKIESINRALRDDLGGDPCQDVAHLMRLPFTVNYPNKLKTSKGRVAVRSYVIRDNHADDFAWHRIEQLPSKSVESKAPAAAVEAIDLPDVVDLSRLSDADRQTIKKGTTASDRSAAVYGIACAMRRASYSDGEIIATIINPDNGISAHILDQKQREPEAQAMRVIARMNEKGVKLPDFDDGWLPPDNTPEEKSRLRKDIEERKARKQGKSAKRVTSIVKGLSIIRGSDIEIENLRFLWENVLARGIHTAMAGEGGQGKSQVTYNIAAACTKGGTLPDGKRAPIGTVVFLNAEDTTNSMFGPRLRAAGADMKKIIKVQSVASSEGETKFSLQTDLEKLKELCEEIGDVVLIVIDPASSYMGGTLDGRQNSQVRNVLDPISKLAEDLDLAVLSVTHFNKGVSAKAVNRVMDSVANVNAPRSVWGVFPDPDDIEGGNDAPRLFVQIKSNIAPPGLPGWSYKMVMKNAGVDARDGKPVMASCIQWTGKTTMTSDQITALENQKVSPRTDEAMAFLLAQLDTDPPPFVDDVKRAAEASGIVLSTLQNAKRKLNVKPIPPEEMGGPWRWSLPPTKSPELDFEDDGPQPD